MNLIPREETTKMTEKKKLKLAICRGATCSGCDIAILDIHGKLLNVLEEKIFAFYN